ncbi:hypothetical protein, partial [Sicyoidochytrium minutum DNA virus]
VAERQAFNLLVTGSIPVIGNVLVTHQFF